MYTAATYTHNNPPVPDIKSLYIETFKSIKVSFQREATFSDGLSNDIIRCLARS